MRAQPRSFSERTGGSQAVPPEWKLPILFKMIILNMMNEMKIKHKYTIGMDKTYEGFSRLLIEMAHEKSYDRRTSKGRGENDIDVDALAAAAAAATAERRAWHGDYEPEDDAEYSEKDWAEWELEQNKNIAEAQEELNWLGARGKGGKGAKGGKGKGKGGGGKGYGGKGGGKGKGKGSSACSWCGEECH